MFVQIALGAFCLAISNCFRTKTWRKLPALLDKAKSGRSRALSMPLKCCVGRAWHRSQLKHGLVTCSAAVELSASAGRSTQVWLAMKRHGFEAPRSCGFSQPVALEAPRTAGRGLNGGERKRRCAVAPLGPSHQIIQVPGIQRGLLCVPMSRHD